MFLKHIISAVLFCVFTFNQVAEPVFCHSSGRIHLFNSGCAGDTDVLLFVNDDDGATGHAVAPLAFDTYLPPGSETTLKATGLTGQKTGAARPAAGPAPQPLYVQYRVFRI